MIKYLNGDIFKTDADALAHGCNTIGRMGRGIASELRERYPEMYQDYKARCRKKTFLPGTGYMFENEDKPHIINLATQSDGGACPGYVDLAFSWLAANYERLGLKSVAMPRIATSLGGLEWEVVKELMKKNFEDIDLEVRVYTSKRNIR